MTLSREDLLDIFCKVLDMKEQKRNLYNNAMTSCKDDVAKETFRFLRDSEDKHLRDIRSMYDKLKQGSPLADACRYTESEENIQKVFAKLAKEHKEASARCDDDTTALETGIRLEEASIRYFEEKLQEASDPMQKEFLQHLATEERQHRMALADLKFYYSDPQAWYMEKSGARLDGAGSVT